MVKSKTGVEPVNKLTSVRSLDGSPEVFPGYPLGLGINAIADCASGLRLRD